MSTEGRVWIDAPEFKLRAWGELISVAPAPDIAPGPGRVVLTTVTHVTNDVLSVYFEGWDEPLHPTRNHTLWSETRAEWVPAEDLRPNEVIRTAQGPAQVANVAPHEGAHRVHNLEVEGEHVYYVSALGVLGHNCGGGDAARGASRLSDDALKHLSPQMRKSVRSWEKRLVQHRDKLEAYRKNPDAFDNKGFLKNAPTPEIRQRIIDTRIHHLKTEIRNFEKQIADALGGG